MHRTVAVLLIFIANVAPALAAPVTISLDNVSGESLDMVTATPKGSPEISEVNRMTGTIGNGEAGEATFEVTGDECVYDLRFVFSSGRVIDRPDMDLCQTGGIIVE